MNYIRQIRKQNGLKLADLAKATGVSVGFVNHIESGRAKLPEDRIADFAKALRISNKALEDVVNSADSFIEWKKSWISQIKINGYPLLQAFAYHIASRDGFDLSDPMRVQRELINFVRDNISQSLVAELTSNNNLLPLFIQQVNQTISSK